MSSVVGHALAATVVAAAGSPWLAGRGRGGVLALAAAAALSPDLDVVWMALRPGAGDVHRGVTHGLPFAAVVAGVLAAAGHRLVGQRPGRLFLVLFAAAGSHLLLDFLMGAGAPIRPLRPFSGAAFQAPATFVPVAWYARSPAAYALPAFWIRNAAAALLEVAILAPWLVVLSPRRPARTRALAAALSAAGVLASVALFTR